MTQTRTEAREMRKKIARWVQDEPHADEPRFARLRSGDMAQCNEPEPRGPCIRCLVFIGAITIPLGFVAAFAFGDVPPHYEAPRGHDICKEKGC